MERIQDIASGARRGATLWRPALLAAALLGSTACGGLLDVQNPNNVTQEDLDTPTAAGALVHGALNRTEQAFGSVALAHAAVTDWYVWRGSFDFMNDLDRGLLDSDGNQYTRGAFDDIAVARWLGDETINTLEGFQSDGTLKDPDLLAQAYLYTAITYATIPDMFEDFAFSDRQQSGPPVGPENMYTLYDKSVERLDKASSIAQTSGDPDLVTAAMAMKARAEWAQDLWHILDKGAAMTADPLISDAKVDADARAALARMSDPDWKYRFTYGPTTLQNTFAYNANSRLEVAIANEWVTEDNSGKKSCAPFNPNCPKDALQIMDPIDHVQDPALLADIYEFIQGFEYSTMTVVSARELHLILAESALKQGDMATFTSEINAVRAVTPGLTPYDPAVNTDITPLQMLQHERKANLFAQVQRRLADMYRFGEKSPRWDPAGTAINSPGRVFLLSSTERAANCYIQNTCS